MAKIFSTKAGNARSPEDKDRIGKSKLAVERQKQEQIRAKFLGLADESPFSPKSISAFKQARFSEIDEEIRSTIDRMIEANPQLKGSSAFAKVQANLAKEGIRRKSEFSSELQLRAGEAQMRQKFGALSGAAGIGGQLLNVRMAAKQRAVQRQSSKQAAFGQALGGIFGAAGMAMGGGLFSGAAGMAMGGASGTLRTSRGLDAREGSLRSLL